MAALESCRAALGEKPPTAPISEQEIRDLYAYLVQARDCLIGLGFAVDEPPTVEEFMDTYATGPWSPFNEVADQTNSQASWEQANEACPQSPDG